MAEQNRSEREKLVEAYEESLFRLALYDSAEQEGKQFLQEREQCGGKPENHPSPEAEERFRRKLPSRLRKSRASRRRPVRRVLGKVAVCFLAVAVVFSTAMVTVRAFRVQVMNLLIDVQPEYTSFQIRGNTQGASGSADENLAINWKNAYLPTYIPEGYEIDGFTYTEQMKNIFYSSSDKKRVIDYSEADESVTTELDTENASVLKTVLINGQKGKLVIKNSTATVVWEMDRHIFTLSTEESEEEALKIARGVKFVE